MGDLARVRPLAVDVQEIHQAKIALLARKREELLVLLSKAGATEPKSILADPLGRLFQEVGFTSLVPLDFSPDVKAKVQEIQEVKDQVIAARRDFITKSLQALGLQIPEDLKPLEPAQALVLAVRGDLVDTEQRIERMLEQVKLGKTVIPGISKSIFNPLGPIGIPWELVLLGLAAAAVVGILAWAFSD